MPHWTKLIFGLFCLSVLGADTLEPNIIREARQLSEDFEARFSEVDPAKLTAKQRAFFQGILLPLLGPSALFQKSGETIRERPWTFDGSTTFIKFGEKKLSIRWAPQYRYPQVSHGTLCVPLNWNWSATNLREYLIKILPQWLHGLPGLKRIFEDRIAQGEWLDSLPLVKQTKAGFQDADILAGVKIPRLLEGALKFSELRKDSWIIHPHLGFLQVLETRPDEGGTLIASQQSSRNPNRNRVRLTQQENLIFANRRTSAERELCLLRAKAYFKPERLSLVFAYKAVFDRFFQRKIGSLETIFKRDRKSVRRFGTLPGFLVELKDRLQFRGIGPEVDYQEFSEAMHRFLSLVYQETGEDLVRSGVIMDMQDYTNGAFTTRVFFSDQFRNEEPRTEIERQLTNLPKDVDAMLRTLAYQRGTNGLGNLPTSESSNRHDLHVINYYSSKHPWHETDALTQDMHLLMKYRSLQKAWELIRKLKSQILATVDIAAFDVVTFVPGRGGVESASHLLTEAFWLEFGIAAEHRPDLLHQRKKAGRYTPQHYLPTLIQRLEAVSDKFGIVSTALPDRIFGKRILLIDDVRTSGTTTDEARRILMQAGAKEVVVLAIAQSQSPRSGQSAHPPSGEQRSEAETQMRLKGPWKEEHIPMAHYGTLEYRLEKRRRPGKKHPGPTMEKRLNDKIRLTLWFVDRIKTLFATSSSAFPTQEIRKLLESRSKSSASEFANALTMVVENRSPSAKNKAGELLIELLRTGDYNKAVSTIVLTLPRLLTEGNLDRIAEALFGAAYNHEGAAQKNAFAALSQLPSLPEDILENLRGHAENVATEKIRPRFASHCLETLTKFGQETPTDKDSPK